MIAKVGIATAVFSYVFIMTGYVEAAIIYNFTGENFTMVTGSAPTVTTSNNITGFVEFATAPLPNETGKTDWVDYELSDGARTLSFAAGDDQFFVADFFDFNAGLQIVNWQFSIVPDGETNNANILQTGTSLDFSRLGAGSIQGAQNNGGGVWSSDFAAVPEPSSLVLALMCGVGIVIGMRRQRNRHSQNEAA